MSRAGMFDPVSLPNGSKPISTPNKGQDWRPVIPVPDDAPLPPAKHYKLGAPSRRWEYRDRDRQLLGLVYRFDINDGKEVIPVTYCSGKRGRRWRWKGFANPRPLYGLDRLALRPDAPVIVTEGEKAADAAGELLPDWVAVTSQGGNLAAKKADWSALAGRRRIVIWRDGDEPGEAYARAVCDVLAKLSPTPEVAIITPPSGVAAGWDAADALVDGWTPQRAADLIAGASRVAQLGTDAPAARKTGRGWLLSLIEEIELWHDAERTAYATVPVDQHRENYEVLSRGFRGWIAWRAYEATGASPSGQALDDALRVAEGIALNRGPRYATWRRVGEYDRRIYVDLGCPKWRSVEIAATGWQIVDRVPLKFLRSRGMEPLPEPEDGELIETLREFVNVETEADFKMLLAYLVAALRPIGPYPMLIIGGQQGASKSTLARICRALIDPSTSPIRSVPKDDRDLLVSAFNSWMLVYDNLSGLPGWLSDALCRISTGGGFATRELHSDRAETIFSATRPIVLNGIGDICERADLGERVVSLILPPIADDQRRTEREFWAAFERARPALLGAIYGAVAAGLRNLATIVVDAPPRMADFAEWAEACGPGFGWEPGEFLTAYTDNRREVEAGAAEASPLVPVIEAVLVHAGLGPEGFDGTATELLAKLNEVCSDTAQRQRWYPRNGSKLGSLLARDALLLKSRGIEVNRHRVGRAGARYLLLRCISEAVFDELRARLMGRAGDGRDGGER